MASIARVLGVIGISRFLPPGRNDRGRLGRTRRPISHRVLHRWRRLRQSRLAPFLWLKQQGYPVRSGFGERRRKAIPNSERRGLGGLRSVGPRDRYPLGPRLAIGTRKLQTKRRDLYSFRSPSPSSCRRTPRHNILLSKPRFSRSERTSTGSPNTRSTPWHNTAMKSLVNVSGARFWRTIAARLAAVDPHFDR